MVFYSNIKNAYSYISVHYIDTMNNDGVNNGFSNGASNGSCVKGINYCLLMIVIIPVVVFHIWFIVP